MLGRWAKDQVCDMAERGRPVPGHRKQVRAVSGRREGRPREVTPDSHAQLPPLIPSVQIFCSIFKMQKFQVKFSVQ